MKFLAWGAHLYSMIFPAFRPPSESWSDVLPQVFVKVAVSQSCIITNRPNREELKRMQPAVLCLRGPDLGFSK